MPGEWSCSAIGQGLHREQHEDRASKVLLPARTNTAEASSDEPAPEHTAGEHQAIRNAEERRVFARASVSRRIDEAAREHPNPAEACADTGAEQQMLRAGERFHQ